MNRRELLEILAVERHAPSPRAPQVSGSVAQRPITEPAPVPAHEAERNRAWLASLSARNPDQDATVIDFNERRSA